MRHEGRHNSLLRVHSFPAAYARGGAFPRTVFRLRRGRCALYQIGAVSRRLRAYFGIFYIRLFRRTLRVPYRLSRAISINRRIALTVFYSSSHAYRAGNGKSANFLP